MRCSRRYFNTTFYDLYIRCEFRTPDCSKFILCDPGASAETKIKPGA